MALTTSVSRFIASKALAFVHAEDLEGVCRSTPPKISAIPPAPKIWIPGQHLVAFDAAVKRWRCKLCLATGVSQKLAGKCMQTWSDLGHRVFQCARYVFCTQCGGYSQVRRGKLGKKCEGHNTRSRTVQLHLTRLSKGLDPITGERIGDVIPLRLDIGRADPVGASALWEEDVHGQVWLK